MKDKYYFPEKRFYKPYQGKGAATRVQIVAYTNARERQRLVIFVETAKEIPSENKNAAFAWKDPLQKVIAQLDDNDISELLLVLEGFKNGAGSEKDGKFTGLFHKNDRGNTVVHLEANEKGYVFGLSSQRDGATTKVGHTLTWAEGIVLREIFRAYLQMKYSR